VGLLRSFYGLGPMVLRCKSEDETCLLMAQHLWQVVREDHTRPFLELPAHAPPEQDRPFPWRAQSMPLCLAAFPKIRMIGSTKMTRVQMIFFEQCQDWPAEQFDSLVTSASQHHVHVLVAERHYGVQLTNMGILLVFPLTALQLACFPTRLHVQQGHGLLAWIGQLRPTLTYAQATSLFGTCSKDQLDARTAHRKRSADAMLNTGDKTPVDDRPRRPALLRLRGKRAKTQRPVRPQGKAVAAGAPVGH